MKTEREQETVYCL